MSGILFIIAAPSGGGKTSLVQQLIAQDSNLRVSVSHVTRERRSNEEENVDYLFVDRKTFLDMVKDQLFLEHANVFGEYYGTSKDWVIDTLNEGTDVILEIDWQGAQQIRDLYPAVVSIFILPPSLATLKQRLTERNQDQADVIEDRMAEAQAEMSHCHEFDYLVINDAFDQALQDLQSIIQAERLHYRHQTQKQADLLTNLLA